MKGKKEPSEAFKQARARMLRKRHVGRQPINKKKDPKEYKETTLDGN